MILVCAWCSRFLGLKEPVDQLNLSHGICHVCSVRLNWVEGALGQGSAPTLVIARSRKDLLPILEDLLRSVPEIGITVDRRVGERRREKRDGAFPRARGGDRRRGVSLLLV
jgi:hypothetical protein